MGAIIYGYVILKELDSNSVK